MESRSVRMESGVKLFPVGFWDQGRQVLMKLPVRLMLRLMKDKVSPPRKRCQSTFLSLCLFISFVILLLLSTPRCFQFISVNHKPRLADSDKPRVCQSLWSCWLSETLTVRQRAGLGCCRFLSGDDWNSLVYFCNHRKLSFMAVWINSSSCWSDILGRIASFAWQWRVNTSNIYICTHKHWCDLDSLKTSEDFWIICRGFPAHVVSPA